MKPDRDTFVEQVDCNLNVRCQGSNDMSYSSRFSRVIHCYILPMDEVIITSKGFQKVPLKQSDHEENPLKVLWCIERCDMSLIEENTNTKHTHKWSEAQ